MLSKSILPILAGAVTVSAHGYVKNIVINGVSYAGYDVTTDPYRSTAPTVVGWATTATDLGFVGPDSYNASDIICHKSATNAKGHAQVKAGDEVFLQWSTWPTSHKGPVLSYLAACGDSGCESVDKTALKFFKIDEKGLVDGSTAPGTYGADQLESNGQGWLVKIPTNVASGFYVLRHEIIALHSAGSANGAQNYPQCFNLEVTGGGSDSPTGTAGTALYKEDDPGILVNIYVTTSTYVIPGPTMISGASEVSQSTSAITATGTATTGSVQATGAASASGNAATTTGGSATSSSKAAVSSSKAGSQTTSVKVTSAGATSVKASSASAKTSAATTFSTAIVTKATSSRVSSSVCTANTVTVTVMV